MLDQRLHLGGSSMNWDLLSSSVLKICWILEGQSVASIVKVGHSDPHGIILVKAGDGELLDLLH